MLVKFLRSSFLLFGLSMSSFSFAANSEEIVDGFSEFLLDRANSNLVAVFERRLKSDEYFQCYFPNTFEKIEAINLENLFSSKRYWGKSLESDLEVLVYRSILSETQHSFRLGQKFLERNQVIELLQHFDYEFEGQRYPINFVVLSPLELRKQLNGFSNGLAIAVNAVEGLDLSAEVCQVKEVDKNALKDLIQPYLEAAKGLSEWSVHLSKYGEGLHLSASGKQALYCDPQDIADAECAAAKFNERAFIDKLLKTNDFETIEKAAALAERIEKAYAALDALENTKFNEIDQVSILLPLLRNQSFSASDIKKIQGELVIAKSLDKAERQAKIIEVFAKIKQDVATQDEDAQRVFEMLRKLIDDKQTYSDRALVALELLKGSDGIKSANYEHLNKSVMFFATIADSEDKDGVKSILKTYTMPAVSFAEKRKFGTSYFISSYLAYAAVATDTHRSTESSSSSGLFVPVGVEFNYGLARGQSISLLLSPIDMAYPINLKINGSEDKVDINEIFAPSAALALGLKNYPLNFGLGYQRGRVLEDVNKAEERFLLFVSFDMPLFRLY